MCSFLFVIPDTEYTLNLLKILKAASQSGNIANYFCTTEFGSSWVERQVSTRLYAHTKQKEFLENDFYQ